MEQQILAWIRRRGGQIRERQISNMQTDLCRNVPRGQMLVRNTKVSDTVVAMVASGKLIKSTDATGPGFSYSVPVIGKEPGTLGL
jgi:hypothetical protein